MTDGLRSLGELEAVVDRGLTTFLEVGVALREIRDRRLFRATHDSFRAYVEDRWGFSTGAAYQWIYAGLIGDAILESGGSVPPGTSANAVSELVPTLNRRGPQAAAEAWAKVTEATGGRRPKPSDVRRVVVDSGLPAKAERQRPAPDLWLIGAAVTSSRDRLLAFKDGMKGPLGPSDRTRVREWAGTLRGVADELDALGDPSAASRSLSRAETSAKRGLVEPGGRRGPNPIGCPSHGRVLRRDGACGFCGYEVAEGVAGRDVAA